MVSSDGIADEVLAVIGHTELDLTSRRCDRFWINDLVVFKGDSLFNGPWCTWQALIVGCEVIVRVSDVVVTSESQTDLDDLGLYLKSVYPETRTNSGDILDNVSMTF